jgi:hypothetical protein
VRTSRSISVAAVALIAACTGDAVLTAPSDHPSTPLGAGQPETRRVVIDSTHLAFAGTAADRAAGHYVFKIQDSVPALAPGDYVAGKQGGLFLGRVVAVSRSPGFLTLDVASATWREVFPPLKVHIPFSPGPGSAPSPYGMVRWGPWERVSGPGPKVPAGVPNAGRLPPSLTGPALSPGLFDSTLSFLLSNFDLCAASGLVTGCANISAKVINAQFDLTGGLDLSATTNFDLFTLSFSAEVDATVRQQLNALLDFQLTGNGTVGVDVPVPDLGFVRHFKVGPDSGSIKLGLVIGVEGDITSTTVEPHVRVSDTVALGAKLSTATDPPVTFPTPQGAGHFDAGVKVIDLGDLGVKISVGPMFEVKVDIGGKKDGLDLGVGADGFEHATVNLSGLLGLENWHYHVDAGTEATAAASLKIPLFGVDLGGQQTFPGPGINLEDFWGTGDLSLVSSTTGKDIFPGQLYPATVARTNPTEAPAWPDILPATLGVNDTHVFFGGLLCVQFFAGAPLIPPFVEAPQDCNLVGTAHTVTLTGFAWNCRATEPLPASVVIRPRNPFDFAARLTHLTLSVLCRSAYAVVRDTVAAMLAGGRINIGGIATALDAKLFAAEAARDAGDPAGADSALVDLANQLRAQSGKHITVEAAAELQSYDTLLRTCYEMVVPICSSVPPPAPLALRSRVG